MSEETANKAAAKVSAYSVPDVTDNDSDEGIRLMEKKPDYPPQYVIDYFNRVRRGKIIKALLFALISQIPLIIVLLKDI